MSRTMEVKAPRTWRAPRGTTAAGLVCIGHPPTPGFTGPLRSCWLCMWDSDASTLHSSAEHSTTASDNRAFVTTPCRAADGSDVADSIISGADVPLFNVELVDWILNTLSSNILSEIGDAAADWPIDHAVGAAGTPLCGLLTLSIPSKTSSFLGQETTSNRPGTAVVPVSLIFGFLWKPCAKGPPPTRAGPDVILVFDGPGA